MVGEVLGEVEVQSQEKLPRPKVRMDGLIENVGILISTVLMAGCGIESFAKGDHAAWLALTPQVTCVLWGSRLYALTEALMALESWNLKP